MQVGGIRIGRRRLAALGVAAAGVGALALLAAVLSEAWVRALLAATGGAMVVAVAFGYRELRRQQRAGATAHADQLHQIRAAADRIGSSADAQVRALWEYLTRGPANEPDTFVLYRIIGNDLPPRHRSGQTLENLRFILEHEPDLPGCQKRWVVNRIVDPEVEKGVITLLDRHGTPYLRIPFETETFRRVGWQFERFEVPGFTYRREFDALPPVQRQWALDQVYHDKNRYVMNNNGARNAALRQGRDLAKWILPWDGNCFLTREAWDQIVAAVAARPYLKYFTVPMARVLDNEILLRPDPDVDPTEEPQLLFRRDAQEEFDENARYGRCPKVELFWRLGITGAWDGWCRGPWDPVRAPLSPEAGQSGVAGWVARLYSGEQELERSFAGRSWQRSEAVRARIDRISEDLAARTFDARALFVHDTQALARQRDRWVAREPGPSRVVGQLVETAEQVLDRRTPENSVVDDITVLALAGHLARDARFVDGGADLLRTGFLAALPATGPGADGLWHLLDAVRMLEHEDALTPADTARLRTWLGERRSWLRDSDQGRGARAALDCEGTWYDVEALAVDAYLDDLGGMLATLRRVHERVGQQFDVDGSQPEELAGHQTQHHCTYNLQGWVTLAGLARRVDEDLWAYQTWDGRGLAAALRWLLAHLENPPGGFDRDRLVVLAHLASGYLPAPELMDRLGPAERDPYQVRQVFAGRHGIRPFWILGSPVG